MNNYKDYKECLLNEVKEIMEHKMTEPRALEYFKMLHKTISLIDELCENNEYEKEHDNKKEEDYIPGTYVDERMNSMLEHFKMYKEYKKIYKDSKKEEDKYMMLDELKHMIGQHELIVEEIMSCGLDCQEEQTFIKEFLQKTYKKFS